MDSNLAISQGMDPLDLGATLIDQGEHRQAFQVLLPLAIAGNGRAQAEIGCYYLVGVGTEHNREEAKKWLLKAAEQGIGSAAHNLGTLYFSVDPDVSRKWYRRARDLEFQATQDFWYE